MNLLVYLFFCFLNSFFHYNQIDKNMFDIYNIDNLITYIILLVMQGIAVISNKKMILNYLHFIYLIINLTLFGYYSILYLNHDNIIMYYINYIYLFSCVYVYYLYLNNEKNNYKTFKQLFIENNKLSSNKTINKTLKHVKKECSICYENIHYNVYVTKCNHYFHFNCLYKWAKNNNSCPLDRNYIVN